MTRNGGNVALLDNLLAEINRAGESGEISVEAASRLRVAVSTSVNLILDDEGLSRVSNLVNSLPPTSGPILDQSEDQVPRVRTTRDPAQPGAVPDIEHYSS